MEGVMMQGKNIMAMTVRTESGDILTETKRLKKRSFASKIPVIRGMVAFVRSLVSGTGSMLRSAEVIYPEEETPSKGAFAIATVLGVALAVGLFILLPSFIASMIDKHLVALGVLLYSVIEGVTRIVIFLSYLALISKLKDIRRTFMYHGAEHKTINCFESGQPLTVENVQKCSTRHNRCGTTFLFFVIIVSILVFSLVTWILSLLGWTNIGTFARMGIRLLLLPFVAGLSYELLRFLAVLPDNKFTAVLRAPGLALQRLTTRQPDDEMVEIAIASFNLVLSADDKPEIEERKFGEMSMPELKALVKKRLEKANITEESEVDWLICSALSIKRGELVSVEKTSYAQYRAVNSLLEKREKGVPLDYILGESEFYGIKIKVNDSVLIPRLDTEILADEVIKAVGEKNLTVLDLMTGSGCIAVAVKEKTGATVTASDISEKALAVAKENCASRGIELVCSDGFNSLEGRKFDIIVSNPPYIKSEVVKTLSPEVLCQPHIALDGGEDGLDFYRMIAEQSPKYLNDGGKLLLEIGFDQREEVTSILEENFTDLACVRDYAGNDRVIIAIRK